MHETKQTHICMEENQRSQNVSSVIQDSKLPEQSTWISLYDMAIFSDRKSQEILDIYLLEILIIFNIIFFNAVFFPPYNKLQGHTI